MKSIVRSIYGAHVQTCLLLNQPLSILANSTLNEKFSVQATTGIAPTDRPTLKYMGIGNGGHRTIAGANSISRPVPVQHRSTDAALYNHIPFVLRKLNNDLTASQKQKYAMRRIEQHGGENYAAYYLKRVDFSAAIAQMTYNAVVNDVVTKTPFIPTASNLNPVPPDLTQTGSNVTTGDYVTDEALVAFVLSSIDAQEVIDAMNIINGDTGYAIISEMNLCTGIDKTISIENGANFSEAIGCQTAMIANMFVPLDFNTGGVEMDITVGATEPLWLLNGA